MRGNEFLDKMELIDPAYIEAAENKQNKRKNAWAKYGALAACLCVVAAGAFAIYKEPSVQNPPIPAPDLPGTSTAYPVGSVTINREERPEVFPTHPVIGPGDEGYISPIPTPEPAPENPQYSFIYDGAFEMDGAFETGELSDVRNMISGFGELTQKPDMAVEEGGACFSKALEEAMEHYGDTVRYRVFIDLYSDGVQISSGSEQAIEEAQRLCDMDYIVALETFTQTEDHGEYVTTNATYYFTLHAEYEQLKNFAAAEDLGYYIMLYDEGTGISSSSPAVVYNGFVGTDK